MIGIRGWSSEHLNLRQMLGVALKAIKAQLYLLILHALDLVVSAWLLHVLLLLCGHLLLLHHHLLLDVIPFACLTIILCILLRR